ncbi:3250_t:CDS:2 [Paraglomus brasilianum]|uniref:Kinase n=1 Tax=Paraglomus brasilianum TaxID=144538 RepID=A0A9N8W975_9GLOM|nr:3250_t:CDS:2 [Paraglomus brasilianum]
MATIPNQSHSSDMQVFIDQLGGHGKLLRSNDGSVLIKPSIGFEKAFYEQSILQPDFAAWLPKYYGSLQLHQAQDENPTLAVAICLENITHNFSKPCVLDLKLGTRLYLDTESDAKKQKMIRKAEISTSKNLGIRLVAFRVYKEATDAYILYDREYGYTLTDDTVLTGFKNYFDADIPPHLHQLIIKRFLKNLTDFANVLEKTELRMYSASLLFVYEGSREALEKALAREEDELKKSGDDDADEDASSCKPTDMRMIDFAHSYFAKGIGKDEGCLLGVMNTIKYLTMLLDDEK